MASIQDLINLAKVDGGKFFVVDETGEAKLVILPLEEYQKLLLGKLQKQVNEVENINRKIIEAQLEESEKSSVKSEKASGQQIDQSVNYIDLSAERRINKLVNQEISKSRNYPRVDLREEVIDPSFDFEGPKIEIDDL